MNVRAVKINERVIRVADDQPTFWAKVEAGRWEQSAFAFLDRWLDENTAFLDCGAWVGPMSLYAAFRARRVVAVEADPAALDQLRRNLTANPELAGKITVVPKALSPWSGPVGMGARRKPGDSMSSLLLADADHSWTVTAITPEELVKLLPGDDPLVVKMDLEGAEYGLLPHFGEVLRASSALHLSLHPEFLVEALKGDRQKACAASSAALDMLAGFEGAPPRTELVGGDWELTRPRRRPASTR
jgi:FkbM family methyltransferase